MSQLDCDIDIMRDVFMTRSQQEAFDRIIAAALNAQAGLVEALRFYADAIRYQGSNQPALDGDKYTPQGYPYLIDVTRDRGAIAQAALAAAGAEQKGEDHG